MANTAELETKAAFPALARTATANGSALDLQAWVNPGGQAMKAILDVGAASGTTPTLAVKFQESADGSTWADITGATFAAKSAAGFEEMSFRCSKRYVRAVATIGGTTPSFTFSVYLQGQKRVA